MAPTEWDREVDIIAIGFGAAGSAVAIAGARKGAEILVLEKQPAEWHTPSTRLSGGQIMQAIRVDDATRYLDRCAGGLTPLDVSRAWAEQAADVVEWVEAATELELVRLADAEHPDFDGSDAVAGYGAREVYAASVPEPAASGGRVLFGALESTVRSLDQVSVVYGARAERLVRDGSGRVVGVQVAEADGIKHYKARNGVVLTCGGYEHDEQLKRTHLRAYPTYFYATTANTGDGVRMAQAIGADLWHMNLMVGHALPHYELDGVKYDFNVRTTLSGGYVFLDRHGRRFINEHMHRRHDFYYELAHFDTVRSEYPRVPCYWIFDSQRLKGRPLVAPGARPDGGPDSFRWSDSYGDEIARGWIKTGDTLEAVVAATGIGDSERAVRSLREYNDACAAGVDSFGRPKATLIALDQPPFYSMELWPGGSNTSGGARRNAHAQVLDVFGEAIPGLYEAGELGQAIGALYPCAGANISDGISFGRIAVEHALAASGNPQ